MADATDGPEDAGEDSPVDDAEPLLRDYADGSLKDGDCWDARGDVAYEAMWREDDPLLSHELDRAIVDREVDVLEDPDHPAQAMVDWAYGSQRGNRDDGCAPLLASGAPQALAPEEISRIEVEQEERGLIREMWQIVRCDPLLSVNLLETLLSAAAETGGETGARAERALSALQRDRCALEFMYRRDFPRSVGGLKHLSEELVRGERPSVAPMEWAWESDGAAIGIEVHMSRPPSLRERGLRNCVEALRETGKPIRGVLLLSTEPPSPKQVPGRSESEWLGALLWTEVEPRLREITPIEDGAALRWSRALDAALELGRRRRAH